MARRPAVWRPSVCSWRPAGSPVLDGHDLAAAGVELDERGRPVRTETLRTTAPHIWAGGDATGDQLFTHVGGYEAGVIVGRRPGPSLPRATTASSRA